MPYAEARPMDAGVIPVIDIGPLRNGGDPAQVARALHEASRALGFIYVAGHGIPREVIESLRTTAFRFFRAPEPARRAVRISARHRGWIPPGGSKMHDDAKADLKESFLFGFEDEEGRTPEDHPLRGPNRWPGFVPELRPRGMRFFRHAHEVARHLMRGFAIGLGLEDDYFLRTCARPLSRASLVYYPAQPEGMGADQFGVAPHTDFGVLTVLCQDEVGGLQVRDANGDWVHAPPIDGTLVVNVGDLLSRWTDGAYRSTPHRVVNRSGRERMSLVLAFDPDPQTVIDARPVLGPGARVEHEPITCGDYLVWRFGQAFSYRSETPESGRAAGTGV
ncbi:MAG: hypothetical protein OXC01_18115 [Immundisolibacterales bacterium]|nr:hypothetical protein [Immundisolibacterales bacterium]